jgi:hypothetical protein
MSDHRTICRTSVPQNERYVDDKIQRLRRNPSSEFLDEMLLIRPDVDVANQEDSSICTFPLDENFLIKNDVSIPTSHDDDWTMQIDTIDQAIGSYVFVSDETSHSKVPTFNENRARIDLYHNEGFYTSSIGSSDELDNYRMDMWDDTSICDHIDVNECALPSVAACVSDSTDDGFFMQHTCIGNNVSPEGMHNSCVVQRGDGTRNSIANDRDTARYQTVSSMDYINNANDDDIIFMSNGYQSSTPVYSSTLPFHENDNVPHNVDETSMIAMETISNVLVPINRSSNDDDASSIISVLSNNTFPIDIEWYKQPSVNCVVLGRGYTINRLEGNLRFVDLSRGVLRQRYNLATTSKEKYNISLDLVSAVHQLGGRFLGYDKDLQMYYKVSHNRARLKASAALREPY